MKLTLEHIVCYPLGNDGIKMMTSLDQGAFITPITQIDFTEPDMVYGNSYLDMDDGYYPYQLRGIHLILRPLSDLTEEDIKKVPFQLGGLNAYGMRKRVIENCIRASNGSMLKYLYKNRFDVHGLIPQGLAIDENTVTH